VNTEEVEESTLVAAFDVIRTGGVIVYPTETLYGIGADATNAAAVRKVLQVKKRKDTKPILVIVHSVKMLRQLVAEIPASAERLMTEFWPGPLTLVFKASRELPEEVTQGSGTVGVRIPSNAFCLELLRRCNCPLTSTSANISGEPIHRTIGEIKKALDERIDLFIDAGVLPESKPSTVVSVVPENPKLIREGVISFESLRKVVPTIER
jgi:L-threonylcarbamoyladenylate synthase